MKWAQWTSGVVVTAVALAISAVAISQAGDAGALPVLPVAANVIDPAPRGVLAPAAAAPLASPIPFVARPVPPPTYFPPDESSLEQQRATDALFDACRASACDSS